MKKYFAYFAFLFLICCKKSQDQVPNVRVDFTVYLNEPSYSNLNTIGNFVYVTGGYRGIIIYHESYDVFKAYDRACPYDPTASSEAIVLVDTSLNFVHKICGSTFNILDGSAMHGPATQSMKQYAAEYNSSSNFIYVHN